MHDERHDGDHDERQGGDRGGAAPARVPRQQPRRRQQQRGQHDGRGLREAGHEEEQDAEHPPADPALLGPQVRQPRGEQEEPAHQVLAAGDPGHGLHVERVHGEEQRAEERGRPVREEDRKQEERGVAGRGVPEHVRHVERQAARCSRVDPEEQRVRLVAEPVERQPRVVVGVGEERGRCALDRALRSQQQRLVVVAQQGAVERGQRRHHAGGQEDPECAQSGASVTGAVHVVLGADGPRIGPGLPSRKVRHQSSSQRAETSPLS